MTRLYSANAASFDETHYQPGARHQGVKAFAFLVFVIRGVPFIEFRFLTPATPHPT